jgi:hypothetical protein
MIHADRDHEPRWEAARELETIGRALGLDRLRLLREGGDEVAAWPPDDVAEPVARARAPVVVDGRAWGTLIGEATGALPVGADAHLAAYGVVLASALSSRARSRRVASPAPNSASSRWGWSCEPRRRTRHPRSLRGSPTRSTG